MRYRRTGIAAAVGVVCAAVLATAVPAQASSCTQLSNTVVMYMPGAYDTVALRRVGDAIYNGGMQCGGATVYNTDLILIHDTTQNLDGSDLVGIDLSGGALGPGVTNEGPSGVSDIEIVLFLHHGTNTVWVTGSDGPDNVHAGVSYEGSSFVRGINLNAGAEQGKVADADVTYQEASIPNSAADEPLIFEGGEGDDTIDASGGAGFYTSVLQPVTLIGSNGNDHLVGGGGSDMLYADPGNDVIDGDEAPDTVTYQTSPSKTTVDLSKDGPQATGALGTDQLVRAERLIGSPYDDVLTGSDADNVIQAGGGGDVLTGRGGNDTLDGGSGSDTASYRPAPAGATQGVRVDLGVAGPQSTGGAGADTLSGIENLAGSPFADVLVGDAQANTLKGWEGEDSLSGEVGDDHVAARDGTRDLVTCGPGADSVDSDEQGVDSIFGDCESTAFAPFVPSSGDHGSSGAGAPPPGGPTDTQSADTVAPVLEEFALSPRAFSAARRGPSVARVIGTSVSYQLSEAATVTFRVQRAGAGRRVRGRCVRPKSKNRGARRCRRWLRVRGTFVHSGLTGVNRLHFKGGVGGRRLRPGRYRLRAVARDMAGNRSTRRTARFTIVR
jgi:Ca2+-binding RTX toxin-like protein